ncbi:hypothetical protein H6P81_009733 [Aristolochia fimbriata]|uniref:Uncharacterized protein n=1 Tax=Aristolochia fimbriata TaxID=158543 RepID=A0AAV7ELQ3_ARIFI|nr:hypothetical protein H6P81_009733 [Aristolochia fimbriata]
MGLTGVIDVDPLLRLQHLRTVSVARNNFDGPFPDFSKIGVLKSLYLSRNAFSGQIPRSLKKVLLSHKRFTGPIPTSLVGATKLIELRLDDNQFSGRIPDFKQPGLKVVNVSHNSLEGPIPAAFSNMDAELFAENGNLCGEPLDDSCGGSWTKLSTPLLVVLIILGTACGSGDRVGFAGVLPRQRGGGGGRTRADGVQREENGRREQTGTRFPPVRERRQETRQGAATGIVGKARLRRHRPRAVRAAGPHESLRGGSAQQQLRFVLQGGSPHRPRPGGEEVPGDERRRKRRLPPTHETPRPTQTAQPPPPSLLSTTGESRSSSSPTSSATKA